MTNSAPQQSRLSTVPTISNVVSFEKRRHFFESNEPPLFRTVWTEELEHRRRAVARWRGSDVALKETMLRR